MFIEEDIWDLVYDNEDPLTNGEDLGSDPPLDQDPNPEPEPKPDPPKQPKVLPPKTFTQDEVNKYLQEEKKKYQTNRQQLIKELENLRENAQLTAQQRENLEQRIEQLQTESLSKIELERKEREKIVKEYDKQIKDRDQKASYWQNLYETEKIQRELTDAAIANKAISPTQVVSLVRPQTKLVEKLKEGKPTGEWETRVQLRDKNESGEEITLEVNATEAIKRMSEMPDHWNLFNSGATGGLGGFNQSAVNINFRGAKPPKDAEEYRRWRTANFQKANGRK